MLWTLSDDSNRRENITSWRDDNTVMYRFVLDLIIQVNIEFKINSYIPATQSICIYDAINNNVHVTTKPNNNDMPQNHGLESHK